MRWHADIELGGLLAAFGGTGLEPLARRISERVLDRVAATAAL
jgi:carbon monoxide dehydrogenase subunit G